jgi:L,D-transpeptidase ErfK/SrfK
VPPGPENPLGSRWMTVGHTSYGIHGTNVRWSIGRMATHGCIRLYEREMQRLFDATPSGTRIQIVYQPFKWGRQGSGIFLEAHPDLYGSLGDPWGGALERPTALGLLPFIDLVAVHRTLTRGQGTPVQVGTIPSWALPLEPEAEGANSGEPLATPTSKPTS